MKKILKRFKIILIALLYVAIYDAIGLLIQLGYILWQKASGFHSDESVYERVIDGSNALMVIAAIICFWIYLVIGKVRKKPLHQCIGEKRYPLMVYIMSGCLAIGTRMLVAVYYYFSNGIAPLKESLEKASQISPSLDNPTAVIIAVFAASIIAPIFEEILFRGIVLKELTCVMRPWAAILLQGIIFGAAHGVLFQSVFAFAVGIVLGVIYYKTGDIKVPVVCHAIFNYSAILTAGAVNITGVITYAVLGILLMAFSMTYILKQQ